MNFESWLLYKQYGMLTDFTYKIVVVDVFVFSSIACESVCVLTCFLFFEFFEFLLHFKYIHGYVARF